MKHLVIAILLSFAANAHAITTCENADGSFTLSISESNPIAVTVMDKKASVTPVIYICDMNRFTIDGENLAGYGCVAEESTVDDDVDVAIYMNESKGRANYEDFKNASNNKSSLKCQISH